MFPELFSNKIFEYSRVTFFADKTIALAMCYCLLHTNFITWVGAFWPLNTRDAAAGKPLLQCKGCLKVWISSHFYCKLLLCSHTFFRNCRLKIFKLLTGSEKVILNRFTFIWVLSPKGSLWYIRFLMMGHSFWFQRVHSICLLIC